MLNMIVKKNKSEDQFYLKIINTEGYVKSFIEILLQDLGVKADNQIINNNSGDKKIIKTTYKKGRSRRTLTKVISNKIIRHFKFFNVLFRFYGVDSFQQGFYSTLKTYINNKFEGLDHPNIWKLVVFDIISSFLRTSKYYQSSNPKIYNECISLMLKCYESNCKSEIAKLYRESINECFKDIDPLRIDEFLCKCIDEFPNKSQTKSDKIIEFINNLTLVFKWRIVPYLEKLCHKIISCDPSLFKISANYSDEVPQSLRIFTTNNSDEIIVSLISYIHLCYKISPEYKHENIDNIFILCSNAVKELETCSVMILNNCMINIITFFSNLYKSKCFEYIAHEFIFLGIKLSFIARNKCANNEVITATTNLLQILFENLEIKPIILKLQKETIETYISDQNWRIRENAMYIFQLSNAFFITPLDDSKYFLDKAIEFCGDENIYAVRRARACLKQVLYKNRSLIQDLVSTYKTKTIEEIKKYKVTNKSAELCKCSSILLAACASSQYIISDWLTNLYLFVYKLIQYVPSMKRDILDCFTDFKLIHLQLVRFQESRYDSESLENLKEIFNINCGHLTAY